MAHNVIFPIDILEFAKRARPCLISLLGSWKMLQLVIQLGSLDLAMVNHTKGVL